MVGDVTGAEKHSGADGTVVTRRQRAASRFVARYDTGYGARSFTQLVTHYGDTAGGTVVPSLYHFRA